MLQLREIECLIALSEHLHFGRAARAMQISQSRMSQTIQEVERRVGCRLFDRTSRSVALTAEGRMLIDRIRPPYNELRCSWHQAIDEVRGVKTIIRIGFTAAASRYASEVVRALRTFAPEYGVALREMVGADPLGALHRGEVDAVLATIVGTEPGLLAGPVLGYESMVLAAPHDHVLATRSSLSTHDFAAEWMLEILGSGAGRPPHGSDALGVSGDAFPGTENSLVRTWHELLALVAAGQGVALLTASVAQYFSSPDVRFVPVTDLPPTPVGLIWRQADQHAPIRTLLAHSLQGALPGPRRTR